MEAHKASESEMDALEAIVHPVFRQAVARAGFLAEVHADAVIVMLFDWVAGMMADGSSAAAASIFRLTASAIDADLNPPQSEIDARGQAILDLFEGWKSERQKAVNALGGA